jgi:hypothetical protein
MYTAEAEKLPIRERVRDVLVALGLSVWTVDLVDFVCIDNIVGDKECNEVREALINSHLFKPEQGYRTVHNYESGTYVILVLK